MPASERLSLFHRPSLAAACPACGLAGAAYSTHACCPTPDPKPPHGVSPCFAPCGQPACRTLGCVRVYNADHGYPGPLGAGP